MRLNEQYTPDGENLNWICAELDLILDEMRRDYHQALRDQEARKAREQEETEHYKAYKKNYDALPWWKKMWHDEPRKPWHYRPTPERLPENETVSG